MNIFTRITGKKIFLNTAVYFMFLIVIFAMAGMENNIEILPEQIIKLWLMSFGLGTITQVRKCLEERQWMLKMPYPLKRLIFAPVYLAITLITLLNLGVPFKSSFHNAVYICCIFTIAFILSGFVKNMAQKRTIQNYNIVLERYKKEISLDEKEKEYEE